MSKSNCHLTAWSRFRAEIADSLSIQYTKNSKLHKYINTKPIIRSLLIPIKIIGIIIQWAAWILVQLGELLRTGRWYHVTWREKDIHKEFVPIEKKNPKWLPPIIFEGKVQEVPKNADNTKT
jgi:hypothetical protein